MITAIIMPNDENMNMLFDLVKANNNSAIDLLTFMQIDMINALQENAE